MAEILAILHNHLIGFLKDSALLWMALNAVFGTAPEKLPTWREFPQWIWSWFSAASVTWCSLHGGKVIERKNESTPETK